MATPAKRRVPGGRTTPKGTSAGRPTPSSRYTPPIPKEMKVSPIWVPILMFACLGIGLLMIFLNYMGVLPPLWWEDDGTNNWYLLGGLVFILAGIITATQYR
jgi:hypothetical protein